MHDGLHIGARLIDAGMQMEFQGRRAVALDQVAVHVDGADVVGGQLGALARADIDEHLACAGADAGMAVVIDDVGALEHANAIDELLLGLLGLIRRFRLAR